MKNQVLTYFLIVSLCLVSASLVGKTVNGYVVTLKQDTIYGHVKTYAYNQISTGIVFNGIDLERFHVEVFFKALDERRYKRYTTGQLFEFGFSFKQSEYVFRNLNLVRHSLSEQSQSKPRFLNLVLDGQLELYCDIVRVPNAMYDAGPGFNTYNSNLYYEYYLRGKTLGLKRVMATGDCKGLDQFLKRYQVDTSLLDQMPKDLDFKQIKTVLLLYEDWLKAKDKNSFRIEI